MARFVPPLRLVMQASDLEVHYECRDCGGNAQPDTDRCPDCGGEIAVYEF